MGTGQRIRQAREARGLTMSGLARAAGLSAGAVSRIERGERAPGAATLQALAQALGVRASSLLDEAETPLPQAGLDSEVLSAMQLVASVMPTLPPQGRARVLRVLQAALQ